MRIKPLEYLSILCDTLIPSWMSYCCCGPGSHCKILNFHPSRSILGYMPANNNNSGIIWHTNRAGRLIRSHRLINHTQLHSPGCDPREDPF